MSEKNKEQDPSERLEISAEAENHSWDYIKRNLLDE